MLVNQETENQFRMTRSLWSGSSKTGKLPTFPHRWKRIRSIWKKLKGAAAQIEDIRGKQRRGLVDVKERERRQRTCASEGSPLTRLRACFSSRCTVHRIAAQPMHCNVKRTRTYLQHGCAYWDILVALKRHQCTKNPIQRPHSCLFWLNITGIKLDICMDALVLGSDIIKIGQLCAKKE